MYISVKWYSFWEMSKKIYVKNLMSVKPIKRIKNRFFNLLPLMQDTNWIYKKIHQLAYHFFFFDIFLPDVKYFETLVKQLVQNLMLMEPINCDLLQFAFLFAHRLHISWLMIMILQVYYISSWLAVHSAWQKTH